MNENESITKFEFDCLAVTHCEVFPLKTEIGKVKAVANVVVNDQLLLRNLRVMDGTNGLFISYPNDPFYKGDDYKILYNPITRQFREHLENTVLEKYQEMIANDR